MKARHLALMLTLSAASNIALAQRPAHTEAKTSASETATRNKASATERKSLASVHGSTQTAKFQQVALALNLNNNQKKSVGNLIQGTRDQLAAIRADSSLSPAQQQQAAQAIELGLANKFVGLLTPAQKKELEALLLKNKQQNANANSAGASPGASPSAPDIPSIDAPSSSDSDDEEDSSSSANGASADSSSANSTTATVAVASDSKPSNAAAAQPVTAKVDESNAAVAAAKPGHLSDAQLAAILNSFVQDEGDDSHSKPSALAKVPSGS
jgi:hypothetical protein